nr:hypothetical protein [Helicobacter pylori]
MRWSFKGVCCRISSRPISSFYGANPMSKGACHETQKWQTLFSKHYTLSLLFWGLTLYFEFAFLGLKVIVSVKR